MATAPLGQDLSVNLGVSPFATPQRRFRPPVMERHDGFSDDGLSYSVIDDWDKLASQALADYEARIKNPRTDIWGRVRPEDTPAALDAELFQPLRLLFGQGGNFNAIRPQAYETDVGIVERDPSTGAWRNVFNIPTKTDASNDRILKMEIDELNDRRRALMSGAYIPDEARAEAAQISKRIDELMNSVRSVNSPTNAPSLPQRTPQIFIGAPPVVGATNTPAIKTRSGNSFKITPG